MILTKDTAGQIPYLLPSGSPPSAISYSVYDPDGTVVATAQTVTAPMAYTVSSGEANATPDDVTLTCSTAPTQVAAGKIARIRDDWGRYHDGICYGRSGSVLRVTDVPHTLDNEAATVYAPEIQIPISASWIDETGNGWRVDLSMTVDGAVIRDTLWFAVGLYTVSMRISPREVMDRYPQLRSDLAHAETRRDWERVTAAAIEKVEATILAQEKWYTQLVSPISLRSAVCAAVWRAVAPGYCPEGYPPEQWRAEAERTYSDAVAELLSSAYTDADLSGTVEDGERNPRNRQFRLVR